jgi:hypothetical protein
VFIEKKDLSDTDYTEILKEIRVVRVRILGFGGNLRKDFLPFQMFKANSKLKMNVNELLLLKSMFLSVMGWRNVHLAFLARKAALPARLLPPRLIPVR